MFGENLNTWVSDAIFSFLIFQSSFALGLSTKDSYYISGSENLL